jgi:aminopeptidase YwaD
MVLSHWLQAHVQALAGERHPISPAAIKKAERYIAGRFRLLGLDVSLHAFEVRGKTYRNIIGSLRPAKTRGESHVCPLIIAAHYDTVQGSPGADDNASGVAVMMEAARMLRGLSHTDEIRFIAF